MVMQGLSMFSSRRGKKNSVPRGRSVGPWLADQPAHGLLDEPRVRSAARVMAAGYTILMGAISTHAINASLR